MYKGFNLKLEDASKLENDGKYSEDLIANKKRITSKFHELILSDGYLDAEELMKTWFPKNEYHVFISHSHKDAEIAECLANWLHENFGLKAFIDSHVWGYANELLQELNDLYAKKDAETYNYAPAIANAAHVHLMLSTALNEVIDNAECLFFLNTDNTLEKTLLKNGFEESRTASPWIMSELKTSSIIRKKLSHDRNLVRKSISMEGMTESAKFLYSAPTEHLIDLSEDDLVNWLDGCTTYLDYSFRISIVSRDYQALNKLYEQVTIEA